MSSVGTKSLILCTMGAAVMLLAGCNSETVKTSDAKENNKYKVQLAHVKNIDAKPSYIPVESEKEVTLLDRAAWIAQKQQGKMYRFGGESPKTGFDCSGLTQFAFGQGAGVALPRTAAEQYSASVKIPKTQAGKGDLVFFNTRGKRIGHVGIYLGDDKFVHAPRAGKAITTDTLTGYWAQKLVGFGRIPGACKPAYS